MLLLFSIHPEVDNRLPRGVHVSAQRCTFVQTGADANNIKDLVESKNGMN